MKVSFGDRLRAGVGRLRDDGWSVVQTALAAGIAWFIAVFVLGHDLPVFAAVSAVISLGVAVGQRGRRAVELVIGIAVGLAIADLIVYFLGAGTLQLILVVVLSMGAAIFLGAGPLLITQAGVSAIIVVGLEAPTEGLTPDRFFDALVGSGVALAVNALLAVDPEKVVKRIARPVFLDLKGALDETAAALETRDLERAENAVLKARHTDARVDELKEAIAAGHETARLSPARRRDLGYLEFYAGAAAQLDPAVSNIRVLARSAARLIREERTAPEPLVEAIRDLSRAVEALETQLENRESRPEKPTEAGRFALKAARDATALSEEHDDLATNALVAQIRSTAVDILRASSGMDREAALRAFDEASASPAEEHDGVLQRAISSRTPE